MPITSEQNYPHQVLLNRYMYDRFKLIYAYLNEGGKFPECYSCLKMIIQTHSHAGFFQNIFH